VVAALSIIVITIRGAPWSNDLSTLTPIDPETLRQDTELRRALGAPDIRHLVTLRAPTEQAALEATEALAMRLADARTNELIADFRVATAILPSRRTQLERRAAIAAVGEPAAMVTEAVDGTLFAANGFAPFVTAFESTRHREPISAAAFAESPLAAYLDTHLYFDGDNWVSLVTLFGLSEPDPFAAWLATAYPDAALVDLKSASQQLVRNYRQRINLVLFGAATLIAMLLVARVGWSIRLLWISGTLSAAILGTIALNALLMAQLSIFNLIALVLVAGLGLDYGLFMSRAEADSPQAQRTRHAVLVCMTSTLLAFLILATSAVPILASLGTTVAIGVCLNYLLTRLGSRRN
jgi:predicted exporter